MYNYTLPLTSALDGVCVQHYTPAVLPPVKNRYPLYRKLGGPQSRSWRVWKNLIPTRIRSPDRPACSQSIYRLGYPGPDIQLTWHDIIVTCYREDNQKVKVRLTEWLGITVFPAGLQTILDSTQSATQWMSWVTVLGYKIENRWN
jgi:hypothetical protein